MLPSNPIPFISEGVLDWAADIAIRLALTIFLLVVAFALAH